MLCGFGQDFVCPNDKTFNHVISTKHSEERSFRGRMISRFARNDNSNDCKIQVLPNLQPVYESGSP